MIVAKIMMVYHYVTVCGRSLSRADWIGTMLPSSPVTGEASSNQLFGAVCPQKVARPGLVRFQRTGKRGRRGG